MRDKAKEKEIIAAATEGPWISKKYGGYHNIYKGPVKKNGYGLNHGGEICEMADPDCNDWTRKESNANAQFIAAARTGWPQDMAKLERLEAENVELSKKVGYLGRALHATTDCVKAIRNGLGAGGHSTGAFLEVELGNAICDAIQDQLREHIEIALIPFEQGEPGVIKIVRQDERFGDHTIDRYAKIARAEEGRNVQE